jgi:hypothetical protein
VALARVRSCCYLVFGAKLFTDCSRAATGCPQTVSAPERHDIQMYVSGWSPPTPALVPTDASRAVLEDEGVVSLFVDHQRARKPSWSQTTYEKPPPGAISAKVAPVCQGSKSTRAILPAPSAGRAPSKRRMVQKTMDRVIGSQMLGVVAARLSSHELAREAVDTLRSAAIRRRAEQRQIRQLF